MNIFSKFKDGLKKSSIFLSQNLQNAFHTKKINNETIEDIESTLISADIGVEATNFLIQELKKNSKQIDENSSNILKILANSINEILIKSEINLNESNTGLNTFLFVGVNGSGKTTTIGKIVNKINNNDKIIVAACDTFRAAAVDQLKTWVSKENVTFYNGKRNQDPASIAYEACMKALDENYRYLFIDTAGRLSNNTDLINQLTKIESVIKKNINENFNKILVLDGTNGLNMINQVQTFDKAIGVNGLIITKLDGTAKGGAIISVVKEYEKPIYYVGLGEKKEDLIAFDSKKFSYNLLGLEDNNLI